MHIYFVLLLGAYLKWNSKFNKKSQLFFVIENQSLLQTFFLNDLIVIIISVKKNSIYMK